MRRVHVISILVVSFCVLLAVLVSASPQTSLLEQIAAIFLGFLGGLAAVVEIMGLFDRIGIPESVHPLEPRFIKKPQVPFKTSVAI